MTVRERILSALFAAFVALKIVEGWFALESWPLSHVPMFAARYGPEKLPVRLAVHGLRAGTWVEIQPFQLGLNRAELNRHLLRDADPGPACGELVRQFNATRIPARRFASAYVSKLTIARPDTPGGDRELRSDCPLTVENR